MSQREDQVGELVPLKFGDELLVLLVGELACVVFKDGLGRLATGCVEEHDRGNIVPVRLSDAGYLLGQDPHRDPVVPGAEAEIDQLPRATLDIFRRGAVIQYEQGVGARKEEAGHPQLGLDLMLQAGNYKDVRVAVNEALVCLVLDKSGAEEHDVIKLASEGAPQLVQKVLCLTGIGGPHDQGIEGQLFGVHLYLCVCLRSLVRVLEGRAPWRVVFVFPRRFLPLGLLVERVSDRSLSCVLQPCGVWYTSVVCVCLVLN